MKNVIEIIVGLVIAAGILFVGGSWLNKAVDERVAEVDAAGINTVYFKDGSNVKCTKVADNTWAITTLDNKFVMTVNDEYMYKEVSGGLYDLFKD